MAITGGAGFLGSAIALGLAEAHRVEVLDREPLPPWFPVSNIRFRQTDLCTYDEYFDCDLVVHAASPVGPVGLLGQSGEIGYSIIDSAKRVIAWCRETGAKLIYISSSEVYGQEGELSEDTPCVFRGPHATVRAEYAQAKLLAEIIIRNTGKVDPAFKYQIIRPFNIAGPRQLPSKGFVLPRFIIQALVGRPLTVYGNGSQRRAFSHVNDVAQGIIAAATAEDHHDNQTWNIGAPGNTTTIAELAHLVCRTVGSGSVIYCDPQALHGPLFAEAADKLPNIDRARSLLGWSPQYALPDVVSDALRFWVEQDRFRGFADIV